jgi:hypothetical protein
LLALLHGQDFPEVKNGLLPVCVLGVWASGEADRLVAGGEINVKPGNEGMYEVIATAVKNERRGEGEVSRCAGVEIEGEDRSGVGNNSLDLDGVDERFGQGSMLERGIVKSVDIIPD